MTSSYLSYKAIRGSDWPTFATYNFTNSILDEMKKFNYSHNVNFLDLYIEEKNWNYINLAWPGASNFFIRLQIEEAVKIKSDYVVIGATSSDRFEIPLGNFNFDLLTKNYNVHYNVISSKNIDNPSPWSMELRNRLSKEKNLAIKHYTSQLYDVGLLEAKSYFYIQSGLDLLEKNNIPYVLIPGPLKHKDWSDRSIVWPTTGPWDLPYGPADNGNHNPLAAHYDFLQTLKEITIHWN
jgi:hypothetical protein